MYNVPYGDIFGMCGCDGTMQSTCQSLLLHHINLTLHTRKHTHIEAASWEYHSSVLTGDNLQASVCVCDSPTLSPSQTHTNTCAQSE